MTTKTSNGTWVLMLAHVAGLIDLVALPLWVGALVGHYKLDYEQAGITVTAFLLGVVGASLWFAPRFNRLPAGALAVGGYALAACALWLVSHAQPGPLLMLLHALAGIGVGCALSMVHGAMARAANPHRMLSLGGAVLGVFAVGFYALVPDLMAERGPASVFLVMAGLMACAAVACLWFPGHSVREIKVVQSPGRPSELGQRAALRWPLVVGVACLSLNQSLIFSFLERIGMERGFGTGQVAGLLAVIGLINLLPSPLAGLLQKKLSALKVAVVAVLLQSILALGVSSSPTFTGYALAASIFPAVVIFSHPFLFGLSAQIDPSGRTNALTPAMLMAGSAIAPALGGVVAQRLGFEGLGLTALAVGALALTCFAKLRTGMRAMAARGPKAAV